MTVVTHSLDHASVRDPVVLTIGTFDGVHIGHQALIHHIITRAQRLGGSAALVTFHPHPRVVLMPERAPRYLQSVEGRIATLTKQGLDLVVDLCFDLNLAQTSAEAFVHMLVDRLHMRELWVGGGFALGHHRTGDVPFLRTMGSQLGFTVHPIRRVSLDGEPISSSGIRAHLSAGNVSRAAQLLGRYYSLAGAVVRGVRRGIRIGFPTANLAPSQDRLLPANGVYATWVQVNDRWVPGATNVGIRPTFDNGARTVETHLIDWQGNLYGQELTLFFVQRLRDEHKFAGPDELIVQLRQDVARAKRVLSQAATILPSPELPAVEEIV